MLIDRYTPEDVFARVPEASGFRTRGAEGASARVS